MKQLRWIFFLLLLESPAWANNLDLTSTLEKKNNYLVASYEVSNFALFDSSVKGSGVKIAFNHNFSSYNLEVYLTTALNSDSSVQSSFTGLGGYLYYSLLGTCCTYDKIIKLNDKTIINERSQFQHNLMFGLGVDQYLLNGSKAIYSASGLGLALSYDFSLFNFRYKIGARYSNMTTSQSPVKGTFYSLGIVFPL